MSGTRKRVSSQQKYMNPNDTKIKLYSTECRVQYNSIMDVV